VGPCGSIGMNDCRESVSREKKKREPQAGPASGPRQFSPRKRPNTSGEGVFVPVSNTQLPDKGEGERGLFGVSERGRASKETHGTKEGPESTCRTNYESQAGKGQRKRQEARA